MLELDGTERGSSEHSEGVLWTVPTADLRMKELRPQDILCQGEVYISDAEGRRKRYLSITKDSIYYSAVIPT